MRVFITGASGFIGSAVVPELLSAGHEVLGLARSDASAAAVAAQGADVLRGDLDDLESLRRGAAAADGVVHLANKHDWTDPAASNRAERAAVGTLAGALTGTGRPLVIAAGLAVPGLGRPTTERDRTGARGVDAPRGGAEELALDHADRGVRVVSARFAPTVHGEGDHGFVALLAEHARRAGAVPYPGDGSGRWSAVHRSDTAVLVRLALERAPAGTVVHAAAEEGVPVRRIAAALADRLRLSARSVTAEQLAHDLPFVGAFLAADVPASSALTRELLGWEPTGPTLLEDIAAGHYDR
ncbi:NAD-dependent epimerase/dehydratase family protein [Vallicoccus soli]|uniref:NAD-dependent epimerase/dehydratase family protein n=1 Tax=Vallicoccus soli TaxID=2339232 RepID=A0A3A3YYP1_9ACTN|nr:NAD-dependent epimerase/dehydratase family protein [Vallicoccus soli]RJK95952.1 NAD-dependent epimerase/dehydratase family protein [Vallicoccus soli]